MVWWPDPPGARATGCAPGLGPVSSVGPRGLGRLSTLCTPFVCAGVISHLPHRHSRLALSHLRAQASFLFPSQMCPAFLLRAEGWPKVPKRGCGMQVAKGWVFTLGQPELLRAPPGKWPKTGGRVRGGPSRIPPWGKCDGRRPARVGAVVPVPWNLAVHLKVE